MAGYQKEYGGDDTAESAVPSPGTVRKLRGSANQRAPGATACGALLIRNPMASNLVEAR